MWTETIQEPFIRWGLVALVSIDILFLFSLSPIRQKFYNIFFATHLIALIVLLFAVRSLRSFSFSELLTNLQLRSASTNPSRSPTSPSPPGSTAPTASYAS